MSSSSSNGKMRKQTKRPTTSKEKKQWIMVAVLILGLCIVLLPSSAEDDERSDSASGPTPAKTSHDASVALVSANTALPVSEAVQLRPQSFVRDVELPRVSIDQLVETNPFVRPKPDPPAPIEPPALPPEPPPEPPTVAKVEPPEVRAVYGGSTRRSALVGESIVQPGQSLPDGSRVLDVTPGGVKLGR